MGASLSARDISALLVFLSDLYTIRDSPSFRWHVISSISKLVDSEVTTYNEVNWVTQQHATVSDPPGVLEFPDSHRIFDQHIREHPLVGRYAQKGDCRALKISDFLTRCQFHNCGLYADFFRRVRIEHQMAFIVPALEPLVVGIALNRSRSDFSERDRFVLNLVRPHLVQAYRNAEAVTLMLRQIGLSPVAAAQSGRVAILVDRRRSVLLMTEGSSRLLAKYFPGSSRAMPRLPDILDRWIKHQENNLAAKGALAVRIPLVVYQENGRLVARSLSGAECSLLVLEEQRTVGELDICQGLGLTHREVEVLSWVAHGKTNADIAIILAMSPRTVEKHLERVFQKLGVETRTAAAACLMRKCHSSNLLRMNQNIKSKWRDQIAMGGGFQIRKTET